MTVSDKRRKPERKIEILQAVITLLENRNHKVTTAALAAHMGFSEAAIYRHFRNKKAIFQVLADYIEDHLLQPVNQIAARGEPTRSQLKQLFLYHLKFLSDYPGLCRVFLVDGVICEAEDIGERMAAILRKYTTQIRQILRRGQAAGEIPKDLPVEIAAEMFVGLLQARALRFVLSDFKTPPSQDSELLWSMFHRSI